MRLAQGAVAGVGIVLGLFLAVGDGRARDAGPGKEPPPKLCDQGTLRTLPAPSVEIPFGAVVVEGDLWVGQGGALYRLDPKSGAVKKRFLLPGNQLITGLATDGKLLYALEFGWSAGKPIFVLDPRNGRVLREIVTEANKQGTSHTARGLAFADGRLYVKSGG